MTDLERNAQYRNAPEILKFNNGKEVRSKEDFELRREEIKKLLQEYEYGYIPEKPEHMRVDIRSCENGYAAGKATFSTLDITVTVGGKEFSFPLYAVIPKRKAPVPAFVFINFRDNVPDRYLPSEEIADRGYAVFSFCYEDITKDDYDFKNGIAALLVKNRKKQSAPGKIALWAWAAIRVMDYVSTLNEIDQNNIAVIGHSRLGKTALLAGAFDERFKYVISNDSGCSGAALLRGKTGENLAVLVGVRHHWFCPRYQNYIVHENTLPLDQHFLLAAVAPRYLLIGSAEEDTWADPESEFISAYLASEAYEKIYGLNGLIHNGMVPEAKTVLDSGEIFYHIRKGIHYLSREDWNEYMDYIDKISKKS